MAEILITGASGVVGRALAAELRPGNRVIGLVHADPNDLEVDARHVCDLRRERLGLGREKWRHLAARTQAIVHSAALTEWGQPYGRYEEPNVEGTRRVIELAREAEAPIHYVGTSFVHALELVGPDAITEDNVVKPYITSKLAAERLLEESGVPYTIFRPTNLVGDSNTGASSRPQIVQVLSDWIVRGRAPFLPVHSGNLLDIVPLDMLSRAVAAAVESEIVGRTYWITFGGRALGVEETLEILVDHARRLGRTIEPPPVLDPDGDAPIPLEEAPPIARSFLKVLLDVSEVTHLSGGVLPSSLEELRDELGVEIPSPADSYRTSLEYWARERSEPMIEAPA